MSKITKDQLWKAIIEELFDSFLRFFYSQYIDQIDIDRGFEFLEKELQSLYPKSESKNRRADKLVKVWLKNGKEQWILIHVEVQGYSDKEFSERVYNMHSRIRDRYHRPVSILIIYTDDSPTFHPKEYREDCFGTECSLKFSTHKLLNHPPETHKNSNNPFSIVMEMAWYALKKNKLSEEHYVEVGKKIVRKLVRKGFDSMTIRSIVEFIRYYVSFENSKIFNKFNKAIDKTLKIEKDMSILELVKKHKEAEIFEKGIEKGVDLGAEKEARLIQSISIFLREGKPDSFIMKELNTSNEKIDMVKKIMGIN